MARRFGRLVLRILIATLILLALSVPAVAGMRVVGNTLGQECYESTLLAPTPRRNADALTVCDRAVLDATVNAYNQAANHVTAPRSGCGSPTIRARWTTPTPP